MIHPQKNLPAHNQGEDLERGILKSETGMEKRAYDHDVATIEIDHSTSSVTSDDDTQVRFLNASTIS